VRPRSTSASHGDTDVAGRPSSSEPVRGRNHAQKGPGNRFAIAGTEAFRSQKEIAPAIAALGTLYLGSLQDMSAAKRD
jgi:hypothetical protein